MEVRILLKALWMVVMGIYVATRLTSASESNGTAAEDVDGKFLLKIGRQLKKPMLTLIGMAVNNLQNKHLCDDWTQWSECGAIRKGYVSTRKRTRICRLIADQTDAENENKKVEKNVDICEGSCPIDYNLTRNGYCIKFYVTSKQFDDAVKQCQTDGGHLINIDSEQKYGDMKTALQGFTSCVYIDGRRKDITSPWLIADGSSKQFFKWGSGEPDNYLCMCTSSSLWYDSTCTSSRPYLCEIVM